MRILGLQPIPFGGQALIVMAVHALLTTLAERSLTVSQFVAEEPDFQPFVNAVDLGGQVLVVALAFIFWILGWRRAFRRTILVYLVLTTLSLLTDCSDLVSTLTERTADTAGALDLLWDTALTWAFNVLTFTVWYWFLDQGGPDRRRSAEPGPPDLAFPQQTSDLKGWENWTPGLLDYLFVAFNTSTAFSPTDTVVLSRSAKVLCMLQASISLVIIAMLAARVVNTLQ